MTQSARLEPIRRPVDVFTSCPLCGYLDCQLVFEHGEVGKVVRCTQCRLKYIRSRWSDPLRELRRQDPGPPPDEVLEKQDSQTDDFLDILKRIKSYQPTGKLLELGCLSGNFLALARNAGFEPIGIEPDPWAAEYARRRFDVTVHETIVPQLHFDDQTFDVVAMFHVMEHLTNPRETLLDLRRILKDSGVLAIEIPIIDTLFPIVLGRHHRHYIFDHTLFMTRKNSLEFLQQAGFEVLSTELTGRRLRLGRLAWTVGKSSKLLSGFLDGAFKALRVQERIVHVNLRDNYRIYCRKTI
jgi:2-polyprenyl-3-methyl-5-hydroxy-6-metoxy-1,4-benzoquinol methylase